jgi:hypothetical protein
MTMKKLLSLLLIGAALTASSQGNKKPAKMAPITAPGYYLGKKNDTIRGEVRTNPDDETELYRIFFFKPAKGGKLIAFDPKKTKGFGFEGRHFVAIPYEGGEIYVERLAQG